MMELGHVSFYVRDVDVALGFYRDVLGLDMVGRIFNGKAALLTGGRSHHELLLIEVGEAQGPLCGKRVGLYHVGWKVGDSLDELKQVKERIERAGFTVKGQSDHSISQSLYLQDPDGNELELYVDDPDYDWRNDDTWISNPVKPLQL